MYIEAGPSAAGGKRDRTRAKLIQTAVELIGEKGFEGTTLDAVARRAGMTRGAIYGNFRNRDDLFMAVAKAQWEPVAPQLVPGASLREQMRRIGEAVAAAANERRRRAVGAASFQVYALTHPDLRDRLVQGNAELYRWAEEQLLAYVPAEDLPMPPGEFVRVVHALTEGLLSLRALTPALMPDELIVAAFEALA
jgi:AcrR family transcriptional regulator